MGRFDSFAAAALLLAIAGCGGADADSATGGVGTGQQQTVKLRVSTIPIANLSAFFFAQERGIFAKHGLDVEATSTAGGAEGIAAMMSKSVDVVYTNYVSVFAAVQQNLPVIIVAGNDTNVPDGEKDSSGLVAAKGITDAKGLEGKTLGTAKLNNINHVYSKLWLDRQGVDSSKSKFVELPYPEQLTALLSGEISGAFLPEPFLTQAAAGGLTVVGYPFRIGTGGVTPLAGFVAEKRWAEGNRDTVDRFRAALAEAVAASAEAANRTALIDAIQANTQMQREDIESITITKQSPEINVANLEEMAKLLEKSEVIKPGLDVESLIFDG